MWWKLLETFRSGLEFFKKYGATTFLYVVISMKLMHENFTKRGCNT